MPGQVRWLRALLGAALLAAGPLVAQAPLPAAGGVLDLDLDAGEERAFSVPLSAGELLHVVVEQRTANVELELFEAATSVRRTDLRPWAWGEEFLFALPTEETLYRLVVRSLSSRAGSARLRVASRRLASSRDRLRFEAESAYASTRFTRAQRGLGLVTDQWVQRAERAARMFEALDLPERQAFALKRVGDLQIQLGRPLDALAPLEEAIAIAQRDGYPWAECRARLTWAEAVYARSVDEALAEEERILSLTAAGNLLPCQLSVIRLLIYDLNQKGDHRRSIELFEQALPIADQLDAPWYHSALHMNVGSAYLARGQLVEAIEVFSIAHQGYRDLGDHRSAIAALDNQLTARRALGDEEGLLAAHRKIVAFVANHGEIQDVLGAQVNYGETLLDLDRPAAAEEVFRRASRRAEGAPVEAQAPVWRGLGQALLESGALSAAKPFLDRARRAHQASGNVPRTIRDQELLGRWQEASGQLQAATSSYRAAAGRAAQLHLPPLELSSRVRAAELLWRLQDPRAQAELKRAIDLVEDVRKRLFTDRFRSSSAKLLRRVYDLALEMELSPRESSATGGQPSAGQIERAFLLAERSRARSLREFLEASRKAVTATIDPRLVERESRLLERAEGLAQERFELLQEPLDPNPERLSELDAEIAETELGLEILAAERFRRDPRRASLLDARPLDLTEAQESLGERTLVSYHLLENRLLVFLLSREGLAMETLPAGEDLPATAITLREALSQPSRFTARFRDASLHLGRALLTPLAGHLDGKRLIISPDGWLHHVPFETLLLEAPQAEDSWADLKFAVKAYEISYAPSAGVMASLGQNSSGEQKSTLVALGDALANGAEPVTDGPGNASGRGLFGSLPHAREEVENLIGLLSPESVDPAPVEIQGHLFVGHRATETVARSDLAKAARFLHFATHAFVDSDITSQSALVLTPDHAHDGLLQLGEILRLRFNADLVTLSACQSAVGRQQSGEGIMSLARGFLFAGASSLVASLWEVSDRATGDLMGSLYRGVLAEKTTAESLREAKLELLQKPASAHPYYWAPFILIGDPN
ncbi:MAG: CHAT domain-containing protein [Acidobacteriota bacterium]